MMRVNFLHRFQMNIVQMPVRKKLLFYPLLRICVVMRNVTILGTTLSIYPYSRICVVIVTCVIIVGEVRTAETETSYSYTRICVAMEILTSIYNCDYVYPRARICVVILTNY